MRKYNLALTPSRKGNEIVRLAQRLTGIADKYLLGEHSLPHVTLYQFEANENEIDAIWKRVCEIWDIDSIALQFEKFSHIKFEDSVYWLSLLPNQRNTLHKMHSVIAGILNKPIKKTFDPHMTLLNTKNEDYEKNFNQLANFFIPFTDTFVLSLGKADDVGQFLKILYRYAKAS